MAEIRQELMPFQTPNFVRVKLPPRARQEGMIESPAIPLADVPRDVLEQMCDDFKAEVLRKAGTVSDLSPEQQLRRDLCTLLDVLRGHTCWPALRTLGARSDRAFWSCAVCEGPSVTRRLYYDSRDGLIDPNDLLHEDDCTYVALRRRAEYDGVPRTRR